MSLWSFIVSTIFVGEDNMGFREKKPYSTDSRVQDNTKHRDDVEGLGFDGMRNAEAAEQMGYQSSAPIDVAPSMRVLLRPICASC